MTMTPTAPADDRASADRPADGDVAQVIRGGDFQTVVRPVVECGSGRVVGYDVHLAALSGALEQPGAMRAAIQDSPDSAELGTRCRRAAMEAVAAIGPGAGDRTRVFLDTPVEALATLADEEPALRERLVLQIDSARVLTHPAATLRAAERARRDGWTVGVRGVGGSEASLAVLPLLDPDVVRIDVGVVREHELRRISETFEAVRAHSMLTGSLVMAEGVTSASDENTVRMLGSSLAAGPFYYARGEHAAEAAIVSEMLGQRTRQLLAAHSSPYTLVTARHEPRVADKRALVALSKELEREALSAGGTAMVLSCFQHARHLVPSTLERYAELARAGSMVAMLGAGIDEPPVPRARNAPLDAADPLRREWTIVVITSSWAKLLTAHDFGDAGADADRRFSYVVTADRDLALEAGRSLLSRIPDNAPAPAGTLAS
jgi:EAL domain-containing protein (putative c-di-GMP-specific phosphodiesterase class I)/DICT domain-containing protein